MTVLRPDRDPFYAPFDGDLVPGEVLRSRSVEIKTETACSATEVVYGSTGTRQQPIAVSGTLLQRVQARPGPGLRPILSYAVGVRVLDPNVAPSFLLRRGKESGMPLLDMALARGWSVAVADGDGLGVPGPHTYCAGLPGGYAMLDIVRVATRCGPTAGSAGAPVLLWGDSEGGRCAARAAELQPTYAPELDLWGVAAGGVPSDLYKMATSIDGGPFCGLGLAVRADVTRTVVRADNDLTVAFEDASGALEWLSKRLYSRAPCRGSR
jgi:hypothetical protein